MNGETTTMQPVQDERKMIPVSRETHRRVMAFAGRLAAKRGARTSMETAIIAALDIIEGDLPPAVTETPSAEAACA